MKRIKYLRSVAGIAMGVLSGLLMLPISGQCTTVSGNSSEVTFNDVPAGTNIVNLSTPGGEVYSVDGLAMSIEPALPDGDYQYELIGNLPVTGQITEGEIRPADPENGRDVTITRRPTGVLESGGFRIVNGIVLDSRTMEEN